MNQVRPSSLSGQNHSSGPSISTGLSRSTGQSRVKPNGLLLVDKPPGMTSHDVVARVRRIVGTSEVGHSGTLDPLASGLMVLLLGEATKLSAYITDGDKSYQVGFKTGFETDTLDSTGAITATSDLRPSIENIRMAAVQLQGSIELPIPMFSAKKVDGKKMYELARDGVVIEQPKKIMKFWSVEKLSGVESQSGVEDHRFQLSCSKGSFIRSWVFELGRRLGSGACMTELRRVKSHVFKIEDALTLEALAQVVADDVLDSYLIPLHKALSGVKSIRVRDMDLNLLKNGQISQALRLHLIRVFEPEQDEIVQISTDRPERLVGLVGLSPEKGFVIRRVFNT